MKLPAQCSKVIFAIAITATLHWPGAAAYAQVPISQAAARTEHDALVKAAKAEPGGIIFYLSAGENVGKRSADAFEAKYGIKAKFIRLSGIGLLQRYAAEADSGAAAADLFLSGNTSIADEWVKKGWLEPIASAALPVVRSGEFPAKFNRGSSALVQLTPWLMFYNTDKVKGADIPRDWPDLLNPRWKGQFLLGDPRTSDAYTDFWALLLDKYGESFFTQMRAQNPRVVNGGPALVQALAAGEGWIAVPQVLPSVLVTKDKGGPLETVTPDFTTGVEIQVMITARAKSKHFNSARLFANYIMSPDGNKVLNSDPGGIVLYDTSSLPKQYEPPKLGTASRKDHIYKLLGLQ